MIARSIGAALLWAAPTLCAAATGDGQFAADGAGRVSCAGMVEAVSAEGDDGLRAAQQFASWLSGFFDAANVFTPDTYDATPWQTPEVMLTKIRVYCAQNPDEAVVVAAMRLLETLLPARVTEAVPRAQARSGGRAVALYPQTLAAVRAALVEAGHDIPATGEYDDAMAAAIVDAQRAAGLPQTGLPDVLTLILLLDRAR